MTQEEIRGIVFLIYVAACILPWVIDGLKHPAVKD